MRLFYVILIVCSIFACKSKKITEPELDMEILNVMGAKVYSEKIISAGTNLNKTYQNVLSSGLYYVRINADTESRILKLIIN